MGAQRRQRGLRQWLRHGRLSAAIAVAEALHHSAPLRAWPEMNAAPRTDDGQAEPRALGTFRRTTRRKCWPPSEVRTQDKGVEHVMEQITETLPARAVVRSSQLVGRADGGSKVQSWWMGMAAKSSWKLQQMDVTDGRTVEHVDDIPVPRASSSSSQAGVRQLVVEQNLGAAGGRVGQTSNVASQRKRADTHCVSKPQSRSNTFHSLREVEELMQPQLLLLSVPTGRENCRSVLSAFMRVGYLKEEARSGGVD